MSSTKFPTWFFCLYCFHCESFSRAQLDRYQKHFNTKHVAHPPWNLPVAKRFHSASRWFDVQEQMERKESRLELTGVEAEVAAPQSGGIFTAREEQRAAVEGVFFFSAADNMFSLRSRPALTRV